MGKDKNILILSDFKSFSKIDKILFLAVCFLIGGVYLSVTIPSLFHILMVIPIFYYLGIKKYFPKLSISNYFLIAFLGWHLVSYFFNFDQINQMADGRKTLSWVKYGLISVLSIYPLQVFVSGLNNDRKKRILGFCLDLLLWTIFLATTYGLILKFFHFDLISFSETTITRDLERNRGLTGIMRYSYGLSMTLTLVLGLMLTRFLQPSFFSNYLRLFFVAVSVLGLYLSYSRGALLALTLGTIPLSLLFLKQYFWKIFGSISLLMIIIFSVVVSGGIENSPRYLNNSAKVSDQKRVSQFRAALYAGKENPVFGLGPKQFKHHVLSIKKKYQLQRQGYISHAHNIFLEIFANLGFPGLILFLMFIFFWIAEVNLLPTPVRSIFLPFIFVFLIAGQFENIFDANNSFFIFFIYSLSKIDYWKLKNETV